MASRKKVIPVVDEPTETCKTCRHSWFVEGEEAAMWFCRRFPPTVTYDYEEGCPCSSFPVVDVSIVCGEYAPKMNS